MRLCRTPAGLGKYGIGSKRIGPLFATADAGKLQLMRLIKRSVDPQNILNPGKLLPADAVE